MRGTALISYLIVFISFYVKQTDSTVHHTHTCPSSKKCDGCVREVVKEQPTCRVYENSASFSEIFEVEDTNCVHPKAYDGFEVWGNGIYVANKRFIVGGSGQILTRFGNSLGTKLAIYEPPLVRAYAPVKCSATYELEYSEGEVVYELSHGSDVYIMMIRKATFTHDQLMRLSSTLNLPSGWVFQQRTLSSDIHVYTPSDTLVVLDEFDNVYILLMECHLHERHSGQKGLNWIIGISFLIILFCAASFMCIRLYYIRRKRNRKRKLVKANGKVKRYDSTPSNKASGSSHSRGNSATRSNISVSDKYQDPLC